MFLSESECFVVGALDAAHRDLEVPFFDNLRLINQLLGLAVAPTAEHKFCAVGEVPEDTCWAKGDIESRLSSGELAELRDHQMAERRHAEEWIQERPGLSDGGRAAFNAFLNQIIAFGYAPSKPEDLFGLSLGGDLYLIERVQPLAPGLLRELVVKLSPSTPFSVMWRAAVPSTIADVPEAFWREAFAAGPSCTDALCGTDNPQARAQLVRSLCSAETHPDAHKLGESLWAAMAVVRRVADHAGHPSEDGAAGEGQAATGEPVPLELSPDTPELLQMFFEIGNLIHASGRVDGEQNVVPDVCIQIDGALKHAAIASTHATNLGMPSVKSLIADLQARLTSWRDNAALLAFLGGDAIRGVTHQEQAMQAAQAAFCVAYGDMLLRERYSPAPIPRGEARERLLRQPENIRVLITTALSGLRKDIGDKANFSVELVLLCNVLERLVRDAAEVYLRDTRSHGVADLLYELRQAAKRARPEDIDDMETITRVGTALHHAFRNRATHQIATLPGGINEAMFVAYGTLVLLAAVERAANRIRPQRS
jgi:hypothetical protein